MSPRKPRDIRPDEMDLWRKVVEHAERMHPNKPAPEARKPAAPSSKPAKTPPTPPPSLKPFRVGETAKPAPKPKDPPPHQVRMDPKRFGQMKKGRLTPEARIDLHGMTQAEAHPALIGFITRAVSEDRRLVLVITGKGKVRDHSGPIPERHGVLRHQVPHWLHSMPLKQHVLQVTEAHTKHGGHGAFYVYLRRRRG